MKPLTRFAHFFRTLLAQPPSTNSPASACPNCWGYQEWDTRIRQLTEDRQLDVRNGLFRYAFIRDFVVKRVDGIRLRPIQEYSLFCMACKAVFIQRDRRL